MASLPTTSQDDRNPDNEEECNADIYDSFFGNLTKKDNCQTLDSDELSKNDTCEEPLSEEQWYQLNKIQQRRLLEEILFSVIMSDKDRPSFLTEQEWRDMTQLTNVDTLSYRRYTNHFLVIDLDRYAYRYANANNDKFWMLVDFFENSLPKAKIGNYCLIQSAGKQNLDMYLYINMQAVFFWLSQQETSLNSLLANLSI
jgi:hypothetical protein